jgi:hypothetical protein
MAPMKTSVLKIRLTVDSSCLALLVCFFMKNTITLIKKAGIGKIKSSGKSVFANELGMFIPKGHEYIISKKILSVITRSIRLKIFKIPKTISFRPIRCLFLLILSLLWL